MNERRSFFGKLGGMFVGAGMSFTPTEEAARAEASPTKKVFRVTGGPSPIHVTTPGGEDITHLLRGVTIDAHATRLTSATFEVVAGYINLDVLVERKG